ncbi:hypothetical protein IU451_28775 [Nocardia cyriacigeorgica]|uniref:hypothetical protein n=1 Tax=Nocardia cyriacigeorgica TaxID=135487 RepID=UPI0018962D47|nr:hypothetical protein [Nocardia cyriacigeorgica]MBF6326497.1 hypothetical protein [Nocardia cyriacigeorgica]
MSPLLESGAVTVCWCGRPPHDDLLDGCLGDPFLRALFGPPGLDDLIYSAITMAGDLIASAGDDPQLLAAIMKNLPPVPQPSISMDRAFLRMAGMDVSDDDIRSLRDWYWPGHADSGSLTWG